jgi:hypothetical protein
VIFLGVVNTICIPITVLVQDLWSRKDIINKGNFFCSVPVENMKIEQPSELCWLSHVYTHLRGHK